MGRWRTSGALVVAAVVIAVFQPVPADADHQAGTPAGDNPTHWDEQPGSGLGQGGDEYRPWVSAPTDAWTANPATGKWPLTSAAEWRWTSTGSYPQGFLVGPTAPNVACPGPHQNPPPPYPAGSMGKTVRSDNIWWGGGIVVCFTDWIDPDLHRYPGDAAPDAFGVASWQHTPAGTNEDWHTRGVLIEICANCGPPWGSQEMHVWFTHEYGHAIGLDHITTPAYSNSPMWHEGATTETPNGHDVWALADTYAHQGGK